MPSRSAPTCLLPTPPFYPRSRHALQRQLRLLELRRGLRGRDAGRGGAREQDLFARGGGAAAFVVVDLLFGSSSFSPSLPSSSAYLASVANLRAFDAVGRDVAARWSWPSAASPDGNGAPLYSSSSSSSSSSPSSSTLTKDSKSELESGKLPAWGRPTYRGGRSLLYRESGVRAARGAALGPDAVLGAGTRVGDGAVVAGGPSSAATGRRPPRLPSWAPCWVRCRVGDGAVVLGSLLCDGAVVLPGARVEKGCVLSFGVVVGAGCVVPAFSRVSLMRPKEVKKGGGDADDAQSYSSDEAPDGFGRPGLATSDDDEDEEEESEDDESDDGSDLNSDEDDECASASSSPAPRRTRRTRPSWAPPLPR